MDPRIPEIPDFAMLRRIGQGAFGDVWIARNVTGVLRAIKVVWRDHFSHAEPYEREFRGLQRFARISIACARQLALLHVGRNDAAGFFYSVMELADDAETGRQIQPDSYVPLTLGELRHRKGYVPADQTIQIGADLAHALMELHQEGLIHRDIKPSNIILVGGVPKLADVGLITRHGDAPTEPMGTAGFVPPEGPGTHQADIYAMGKVLYELASGLDREQYPRLPDNLDSREDRQRFFELNEVIERACSNEVSRRFVAARELFDELNLLLAGKSVLRLRAAERWGRRTLRTTILLAILSSALGGLFWYQRLQERAQRDRLADSFRQQSIRLAQDGNPSGSLPWLIRASELREPDSRKKAEDFLQVGLALQQTPNLDIVFRYSNHINDVCFSPDNTRLAVAVDTGEIDFWNLRTGRHESTFTPFEHLTSKGNRSQGAQTLRYSSNGGLLVCAGDKGAVALWNPASPKSTLRIFPHTHAILAAVLSPDTRILATTATDGVIRLWQTKGVPRIVREIRGLEAIRLAISPDGRFLAAGGKSIDGQSPSPSAISTNGAIFDLRRNAIQIATLTHKSWIYDVSFSPDGRQVATASADQTVCLWNVTNGRRTMVFPHSALVSSARWSADGQRLITAAWDGYVRRWDLGRLWVAPELFPHPEKAHAAACSPDQRWLAAGGDDGVLRIWRLFESAATTIPPPWTPIFTSQYWIAATNAQAGLPMLKSSPPEDQDASVPADRTIAYRTDIAHNRSLACVRDGERTRAVWTSPDGHLRKGFLPTPCLQVLNVGLNPARILYTTQANEAVLWAPDEDRILLRTVLTGAVFHASHSRPGGEWATLESSTHVDVFSLITGKPHSRVLQQVEKESAYFFTTAAFSPDGRYLAVAGSSRDTRHCSCFVYPMTPSGPASTPLDVSLSHRDGIRSLTFSPDSTLLVTTGEDRDAIAWSTRTWQPKVPTMTHVGEVWRSAISDDGTRLLTASETEPSITDTLCLWDLTTGLPITSRIRVHADVRVVGYVSGTGTWAWRGRPAPQGETVVDAVFLPPLSVAEMTALQAKAFAQMGFRVNDKGSVDSMPFQSQYPFHVASPGPVRLGGAASASPSQ